MALTFNLPSQIVVQTAAQWAADNTVYSSKRILVTSDAYYGSTDQRKIKIADGTQTWAQLDYFPLDVALGLTLAQVLANGNETNQLSLNSNSGESQLHLLNAFASFGWFGAKEGSVLAYNNSTIIYHDDLVQLNATSVTKNGSEVITSANITSTITNGVTDKAPSEDAVYDALATKQDGLIFKQNTTITHTGTTTPTVIASFPIPIGFNEANDFWHIWGMCGVDITGGGGGNNQIRMYIGPNPTDIGGATYTSSVYVSSTLRTYPIARTFVFKNSLTTFEGNGVAIDNIQTDYTASSNAPASVTIDLVHKNIYIFWVFWRTLAI